MIVLVSLCFLWVGDASHGDKDGPFLRDMLFSIQKLVSRMDEVEHNVHSRMDKVEDNVQFEHLRRVDELQIEKMMKQEIHSFMLQVTVGQSETEKKLTLNAM